MSLNSAACHIPRHSLLSPNYFNWGSILTCPNRGWSTHSFFLGCHSPPHTHFPESLLHTLVSIRMVFPSVNQVRGFLCLNVPPDIPFSWEYNSSQSDSTCFIEPGIFYQYLKFVGLQYSFLNMTYNSFALFTTNIKRLLKNLIRWLYNVTFCLVYFKQICFY